MIDKIISAGQTGVDRAALDVALDMGIKCGGWCPAGRDADDGVIPDRYPLVETENIDHTVRTEFNVKNSDGTLILNSGELHGGTAYAVEMAKHLGRPVMVIDVTTPLDGTEVIEWIDTNNINVLHVGGPRESSRPGIYDQAHTLLSYILTIYKQQCDEV